MQKVIQRRMMTLLLVHQKEQPSQTNLKNETVHTLDYYLKPKTDKCYYTMI